MPAPKKKPGQPRPQRAATPKRGVVTKDQRRTREQSRSQPRITLPDDLIADIGGPDRLALIRADLPEDASDGDLLRLLLEARRLGADPTRRDLYLKRSFSRDGGGTGYDVVAKRDALLRHAEAQSGFEHAEGAIFDNDTFARSKPSGFADTLEGRVGIEHTSGHPKDRGALWGAWCAVAVGGKEPIVRVISAEDYIGTAAERAALDPEDPRRLHPDQCMIAAAMSLTIRIACSLNDVVGADEMNTPASAVSLAVIDDEDERTTHLTAKLGALLRASALIDPLLWTATKLRARLENETTEAVDALIAEVAADLVPKLEARRADMERFDATDLPDEDRVEYDRQREEIEGSIDYLTQHLAAA
jgi:hypothetical protein